MKIFKFKKMKSAFLFLLVCLLTDCIAGVIFHYTNAESYDTVIVNNYNSPVLF
jgi:hypothetical protein